MTSQDPLKSVISISSVDDTSLALPSVNQYRSGQERVLDQVQTIKRTRSRKSTSSRSGSTSLSPTSPGCDFVFSDASKSQLSASNGSVFYRNGFSQALGQERNINRQVISSVKGSTSTFPYERGYAPFGTMAAGQNNTSCSEPNLIWQRSMPKRSGPPRRLPSNRGTPGTIKPQPQPRPLPLPQPQPQHTVNGTGRTKGNTKSNGNSGVADITMKEAVEYLSLEDEAYKHCGASYIQHSTFTDNRAREEVLKHKGISPLVGLLRSPSLQVHQTASAALRNLSFKNNNNKEEINRCGGIAEAAALLRDTDSVEIQKQLTGLLWNLSSVDDLKPELVKTALPVLMERVILPYTSGPDQTNSYSQDPEVFFHATGCLRNLSSAKQSNRQALRKCRGLVDSLVTYVNDSVEARKPDDKSVENCVCILHNLTFQLEDEAPALFSRITAFAKPASRSYSTDESIPISCFSPQSKSLERERNFDIPDIVDPHPSGAGWLIHNKSLQNYLTLLGSSQREETQEACCGALQNLTTNEGIVSDVMSHIIVQKLHGMETLGPLLKSNKVNLQRNAVALVGNLTKNPTLHSTIAQKSLPGLMSILSAGTQTGNESDDTLAMACQITNLLLMKEPEIGMHLLNKDLINSLSNLSLDGYYPKSKKAAALLLYKLWSEKDLQSILKKRGMSKSLFVNDITTAAHRSVQIVD